MTNKYSLSAGTSAAGKASLSRRGLFKVGGALALASLAGCTEIMSTRRFRAETGPIGPGGDRLPPGATSYAEIYGPEVDEGYHIPAIPYQRIDPAFYRQIVDDPTGEEPGTIVVDPNQKFLYHVMDNGEAMRYGVGVGREGFAWSGRGVIQWKQKWPTWTPPSDMIDRQPELKKYAKDGMNPGLMNPLGARAMYIFKDGKDTLYRIHGSPEWWTIGTAASSGCIRMMNQDVINLYANVTVPTKVVVV